VSRCCNLAPTRCASGLLSLVVALILLAGVLPSTSTGLGATIELASKKVGAIKIAVGKSETVRIDRSFADVIVGDPETADAIPLTDRSLSILGRKIGTTRVSLYGDGKALVGIVDVEISYDTAQLAEELARRFPNARFRVATANGRILLAGSVPDAVTLDRAMAMAKQFGPDVINSMRVLQSQQVMLEVRFVEASRTAARELGVNWQAVGKSAAASFGTANLLTGNAPFGTVVGTLLGNGVQVDAMIRGLEDRGLARRLAEPNLVALSGDTASFLAGGEFPFPVASLFDRTTIEFKKFGVGLAFTPTVLDHGLINLKIEPEVSQLDPNNVIVIGGTRIPSLVVRRANTTIELRDGQSFAIAGLLQTINTTDQAQLPWIGEVPVIGALFRSAAFQKSETDLAIIVTPRLVRPARPGDALKTPLESTAPGNDVDVFLLGQSELTPRTRQAAGILPSQGMRGHILDLQKGTQRAVP
jgi:pilus assembly protein CpaC